MKLAFLGAGGHARSVYDIVKKKNILFFDKEKKNIKINNKIFKVVNDLELIKK